MFGASNPWQLLQVGLRIEVNTCVNVAVATGGVVPPELPAPLDPAPASTEWLPPELLAGPGLASMTGAGAPLDAPELAPLPLPPESMSWGPLELPEGVEPDELALWPELEPVVPELEPLVSASSPLAAIEVAPSPAFVPSSPAPVPSPEVPLHPASAVEATSARGATRIPPRRTIPLQNKGAFICRR
jgi:hypothetical protein